MRSSRGFTLIEILIVMVIAGLVVSLLATLSVGLLAQQRRQTTIARLNNIESSLLQFVMQQKRLPCPADGAANAGTAVGGPAGCTGDQARGVVPWIDLGLPEIEVTDGWGRRITYRLDPNLAVTGRMDMSKCDPAGTGPVAAGLCNSACASSDLSLCTPPSTYLSTKGLRVRSIAGTLIMNPAGSPNTGAAFVLISHGETGGGGYFNTSLSSSSTTDGTEEAKNYADAAYIAASSYYVDDKLSEVAGTTHFDDLLVRPTVFSVIIRAGLGSRSH